MVFSNPDQTNTTASFGANGIYVLRLTASDGVAEASSDVTVTVDRPPIVDAGSDQVVTNLTVSLTGTAADDGLPEGVVATALWTKVDGPGAVTFGNPSSPTTTATFSLPGLYLLRLASSDSLATTFDEVIISIDQATGNLDADGDGLPNDWEIRHGLNPFSAIGADGASGDPDGDGLSNLTEYQQGRNPRVAGSLPDTSGVVKLEVYTPLK